jgi:hypothetical protein
MHNDDITRAHIFIRGVIVRTTLLVYFIKLPFLYLFI